MSLVFFSAYTQSDYEQYDQYAPYDNSYQEEQNQSKEPVNYKKQEDTKVENDQPPDLPGKSTLFLSLTNH